LTTDISLNRLIIGTYNLPCFIFFVLLGAASKIHIEDEALVASTKQSRPTDRTVRPACFVLCPLQWLALSSGSFEQIYFEQSTFLIYLGFTCVEVC